MFSAHEHTVVQDNATGELVLRNIHNNNANPHGRIVKASSQDELKSHATSTGSGYAGTNAFGNLGFGGLGGLGSLGTLGGFGGFGGYGGNRMFNLDPSVDSNYNKARMNDMHANVVEGYINWLMYMVDPIAGPVVDIYSNLGFGDLVVHSPVKHGVEQIQEAVYKPLRNINITKMLPEVIREFLVFGGFVALLVYDRKMKTFIDTIPFNYSDCHILSNPLYNKDPIVNVRLSEELKMFMESRSPIAAKTLKLLDPEIVEALRKKRTIELDPIMTMLSSRTAFTTSDRGVSFYSRARYLFILELILRTGTLKLATMRQSAVQHIQMGNQNNEAPTDEELKQAANAIIDLYNDPTNAVFATGPDVQISEIMQGGEFWKWQDSFPELNDLKMKSFGINDAFLSGDMTYNNLETALSVFIEQLKKLRDKLTHDLFYSKLLPVISIVNKFTKDRFQYDVDAMESRIRDMDDVVPIRTRSRGDYNPLNNIGINYEHIDHNKYINIYLEWRNESFGSLQSGPEMLSMLQQVRDMGAPIPLRLMLAGSMLKYNRVKSEMEQDLKDKKELWQYQKKEQDLYQQIFNRPPQLGQGGQIVHVPPGGGEEGQFASYDDAAKENIWQAVKSTGKHKMPAQHGDGDVLGALKRNNADRWAYDERAGEYPQYNSKGKRVYVHNSNRKHAEADEKIVHTVEMMRNNMQNKSVHYMAPGSNVGHRTGELGTARAENLRGKLFGKALGRLV